MIKYLLKLNANLLIAIGILLISACNNDEDFLILSINPDQIFDVYEVGEPVIYFVRAQSSESNLSRMLITVREETEVTKTTILDTAISGSFYETTIDFPRPTDQTRRYNFEFSVTNTNGKTVTEFRSARIVFDSTEVPLLETTGHRIYPKLTQRTDGFDIVNSVSVFTDTVLLDTNAVDIFELPDTTDQLTYIWRSGTNGKFVLFNGFDYPNATLSSVIEAFESGQKLDQIVDIREDDIILFHSAQRNVYAAIKIDEIEVGDSVTNAFYEFNLKK